MFQKIEAQPDNFVVPVKDDLPEYYFGQPIASNNADLTVMKKNTGANLFNP